LKRAAENWLRKFRAPAVQPPMVVKRSLRKPYFLVFTANTGNVVRITNHPAAIQNCDIGHQNNITSRYFLSGRHDRFLKVLDMIQNYLPQTNAAQSNCKKHLRIIFPSADISCTGKPIALEQSKTAMHVFQLLP
jgi:hypothetical protein